MPLIKSLEELPEGAKLCTPDEFWVALRQNDQEAFLKLYYTKEFIETQDANISLNNGGKPLLLWAVLNTNHSDDFTWFIRLLLNEGVANDMLLLHNNTALAEAVGKNQSEIVNLLLAAGANKDSQDKFNRTPLWIATERGDSNMIEILITAGANIKTIDQEMGSLLHCTVFYHGWGIVGDQPQNAMKIAQLFLDAGVDPKICNKKGQTAAQSAMAKGNHKLAKLIRTYKPKEKRSSITSDEKQSTGTVLPDISQTLNPQKQQPQASPVATVTNRSPCCIIY